MESEMIETKDLSFSQKEDPYESSKPIFHKPIYESSLEAFHHCNIFFHPSLSSNSFPI